MRYLLAPFLLLAAAACSSLAIAAAAAFRGPDALTADPATFQVVSSTPQAVQLTPAGQRLTLSATRPETGQRVEEQFALDRLALGSSGLKGIKPAEGENLYLYKLSPEDANRYARLQDELKGWLETRSDTATMVAVSVLPSGCVDADVAEQERLSTFWLSVDEGDTFVPLVRNIDVIELSQRSGPNVSVSTC